MLKDSRKLSLNSFRSRTFGETLTPKECLTEIIHLVPELKGYYNLYQLLLFHLQEKNADYFFDLIEEALPHLNQTFKTALRTILHYKEHVTNAIELPYSNAKLEQPTNSSKTSSAMPLDSRTLTTLKTYLYRFKHAKREDAFRLLSCLAISHPLQLTMSPDLNPLLFVLACSNYGLCD